MGQFELAMVFILLFASRGQEGEILGIKGVLKSLLHCLWLQNCPKI